MLKYLKVIPFTVFYRGKIIENIDDDECKVLFIDFGNLQNCKKRELYPHVICSEVPMIAQRFKLENLPFLPDGTLDQELLDKLHVLIVDKEVNVYVHPDDVESIKPNYVKRCTIRDGENIFKCYRDVEKVWKKSGH